ncbi:MAG TPA: hypothetical protein ENN24_07770 [Bacteroidetes bacterium]|nr:hypothetical protein [Bacteroidota bacterium]
MNLKSILFKEEFSIVYDDNEFCISKKKSNTISTILVTLFLFVSYSLNYYSYYKLGYNKVLYIIIPVLLSIIAYLVYAIMQLIKSRRNKDIWYKYSDFSSISIEKKKRNRVQHQLNESTTRKSTLLPNTIDTFYSLLTW